MWLFLLTLSCSLTVSFPLTSHHRVARPVILQLQASSQPNPNQNDNWNNQTSSDNGAQPALIETIGGGSTMIFEMARRMLVWEEKDGSSSNNNNKRTDILPRWHPHSGISDVNPNFRTKAPIMNNLGYAATIWRNVRKRNKPSLWRHALRTYDRMQVAKQDNRTSVLQIERTTIHHEGALLACSKLGLWKEAIDIYQSILLEEKESSIQQRQQEVTDNMVLSLVNACVVGSKSLRNNDRRAPLDAAKQILESVETTANFPVVARHVNPLAAAYQSIGLIQESRSLIQNFLKDRSIGPEPEYGDEGVNVHEISTKDKGSYALLVKGAVATNDWEQAVGALEEMTEAGLYPNARHLNAWTDLSERRKQRTSRSWKKKREEYWLKNV